MWSSFSFDELKSSLQTHEARINRSLEKQEEKAFQVRGDSFKQKEFFSGRGRGRSGSRG